MARLCLDDDLDIAVEDDHELQQPFQRIFRQATAQQGGQIRLADAQKLRRSDSRQLAPADELAELVNQVGPQLQLLRIVKADIGKDVATAGMNADFVTHLIPIQPDID